MKHFKKKHCTKDNMLTISKVDQNGNKSTPQRTFKKVGNFEIDFRVDQ